MFTPEHLRALELQLLTPAARANPELLTRLLHPAFREFGASGRTYTRAQILAELAAESSGPIPTLTASAIDITFPAPTLALLTYRSTRALPGEPPRHALRSSLWQQQPGGDWQLLFHQGTPTTS